MACDSKAKEVSPLHPYVEKAYSLAVFKCPYKCIGAELKLNEIETHVNSVC